jgi:hypothetical protein
MPWMIALWSAIEREIEEDMLGVALLVLGVT